MTKTQLLRKIAVLESVNDQLKTEVDNIDNLMRLIGFSEGIESVKRSAKEILDSGLMDEE